MRVLQIINSLGAGGAEKLLVETAILYKEKGIAIEVLLLNGMPTPLYDYLSKQNNIKIHTLNSKSVYNPFNILKIRTYLKNYDLIHVHLFPASYWVALANKISVKKHTICFTEHNTTNRRRSSFIFKYLDRCIYKEFKSIITISDAVEKSLKNHLGNKFKNLSKIYNGINLNTFNQAIPYSKEALGYHANDILIIQVASFTPQKDQITLIKTLLHLPQNIKLLLAGSGPLQNDIQRIVKELELENRVVFLGIRNDIPKLLKSVDIVVLASHYEGLSLSCIEGMASGKPFIASNTPGLGDIVEGYGLVFEDKNVEALTKLILTLTHDANFKEKIIEKCLLRAKTFDITTMVNNHLKLYKVIIS